MFISLTSQPFRVLGAPTDKIYQKLTYLKNNPSFNPEFGFIGDNLMNDQGALMVPKAVFGNHWPNACIKGYIETERLFLGTFQDQLKWPNFL